MNCDNSRCKKEIAMPEGHLPFVCELCKERKYCSKSCRTEDATLGHEKVCESIYREKIKRIEKTCPFLKPGILLSEDLVNSQVAKGANVYDLYEKVQLDGKVTSTLGKGSFGHVILMRHKEKGTLVAMKIIDKKAVGSPALLTNLVKEIEIQKKLMHENIVRLIAHVEDPKSIFLIMEYANKGTLFQLIRKKAKLTEREAFFFFTQTCSAIYFLHSNKLMHRDIKPENLLLTDKGVLKLCDFGCCTGYDNEGRKTFCGTIGSLYYQLYRIYAT